GKAAVLHQMAGIVAAQGEPEAAMELYRRSLEITERIGDAEGKAATLANIGSVQADAGDIEGAMASLRQSAAILAGIGAWPDLAQVIANVGALAQQDGVLYLAQAAWLVTAVHVEANLALNVAAALVQEFGPEHETSLLLSLHALAGTQQAERHHQHEQLLGMASGLVGACLQARSVPLDQANTWLTERGLADLGVIVERLRPGLEALVPEDRWLFDRAQLRKGAPPVPDPR
ncbi:MAG: tetratricopeptide repeat protein, partial [Actinomycetota bacterium]|nr:tetratricopeptide repeat protein [Actinomycetota bacterium]